MIRSIVLFLLLPVLKLQALSFEEALERLKQHESVTAIKFKAQADHHRALLQSSWGDPAVKVAAKNFPVQTLAADQTPMTGIEIGITQKIPVTSKYSQIQEAFDALAQAEKYEARDRVEALSKALWELLIVKRKIDEALAILQENRVWLDKILLVSERLYATGKVSQQAVLEIRIRKSEVESAISNQRFNLKQITDKLTYLIDAPSVDETTIPWTKLHTVSHQSNDYRELNLKQQLQSKTHALQAAKLNRIPDLSISLGYTQRANIDGIGDFIGLTLSMPLPLSQSRSAQYAQALAQQQQTQNQYSRYTKEKKRDIAVLSREIEKLDRELTILDDKMIQYARNSRDITAQSYRLGNSTYIELLQSELKLQNLLMHKIELKAQKERNYVALKYTKGEQISE